MKNPAHCPFPDPTIPPALARLPSDSCSDPVVRAQLRELEIMLTSAQRLAGVGSWSWDAAADRITWSQEAFRALGLGAHELDGSLDGFLARVHPDDRGTVREVLARAASGAHQFSYRYRFRPRPGEERLIAGDGESQHDGQGALLRLIGTVMDITERERKREAIRAGEARLRSLVELSTDWYWEQDAQFRFTRFSGGYAAATVLGKRRWEIDGATPLGWTWEEHRAALQAHQSFRRLEYRIRDGTRARYVSVSGEPVYDAAGTFVGYRGTAKDTTERRASEERLRQLNASLGMAMRLGRIGVWSLELPQCALEWWQGGRVIHDVGGAAAGTLAALLERVEPGARCELSRAIGACMAAGQGFELEVPLRAGTQPLMWVRLIGEAHRDLDGRIHQVRGTVQDVTGRRLAAERAREIGSRLVATLDSAADPFVTPSRDWAFTCVNHEAEGFLESLQPGGRWLEVHASPSRDGLAISFRDVTDSRVIRQALADSQEQLRHLFENTIDGVVYTSDRGLIERVNPAARAIFGWSEAELRGQRFGALVATREDGRIDAMRNERSMTGRTSGRLTLRRRDGGRFEAEVSSAEYTATDGKVHAFVVLRDITRRLQAEQQILQLNADLGERVRQRTAELETANAELKAFAHALAHDLQAPVAAVDAFAELLEHAFPEPLPQRPAHYLSRIRAAGRKAGEYITGLLSMAQVSQATLAVRPVDLSEVARELLAELAERDRSRHVQWHVQHGVVAPGDPTLLRMALENLLGNAWKFSAGKAPARIEFGAAPGADGCVVHHVRDNGAGFDMGYAHKLFGSFRRLHTESEFPGTGLGLANVQRIVARHGGRIWAEAAEGEGACFYFTLAAPPAAG